MMSEVESQKSSKPQTPSSNPEEDLNPRETDYVSSKSFLLTSSTKSGLNLYDHLVVCLKKILEEKPSDVVDIFEDISKESKRARFTSQVDTVRNQVDKSSEVELAQIQRQLFNPPPGYDEEMQMEDELENPLPNLLETAFLFEQGGIGLEPEEMYRLWLSLHQLNQRHSFNRLRFWGKLLGTEKNYYVAEAVFKPDADEAAEEAAKEEAAAAAAAAEAAAADDEAAKAADAEDQEPEDPIPKPDYKPPVVIPREEPGTGVNKFVYFVTNVPGRDWVRLPATTPARITGARSIKKFFTGNLDAPVVAYPPFPGNEADYLRAQIARISAGTIISPSSFYIFDEEEEEDEEAGGRDSFIENQEFEAMTVRELVDPSLGSWVHHVQHILPQGRTRWWNPAQMKDGSMAEEDEEEEDKEEMDEPQPEEGPPLLTPLSEDAEIDGMAPWTAKLSSNLIPQYAVAVVSSNAWPGAHAISVGKTFENVYIGWGHKYSTENYSPPPPPAVQLEFPSGPEVTETEDPTPEEEAAVKAALAEAGEGSVEGGEGEEEEEEEDDDN